MRKLDAEGVVELSLAGHDDTVTGLAISPSGNFLLSNSMDSSLRYAIPVVSSSVIYKWNFN